IFRIMAAEMTLFKLDFNGETYKFKCASTGEALFNSIMAKVKSIVKEDDPKLCWKDDDSNLVLASESDLEAAIDWAMVTRKNPAKAPCVHLVVEETQSHPTPAAVQQEAEVAAAAEHAAARLILATPEETPAVVAKAAEQLQMDIMKSKFEDLKVAAAAPQPIPVVQAAKVLQAAQEDSEDLGEVTAEEWEESETGEEDSDEDEEDEEVESETETAIEPSEDDEEEEESDSDSDESDSDEEESVEEETDEEETESEDSDEDKEEDDVSDEESETETAVELTDDEEENKAQNELEHVETVQLQQPTPAVENKVQNNFDARERELKIREKEIEIKED
ncbi:hypothetical protein PENTCL1PPCAC_866, partial [Pristionchus entomophagus]